jgi:hypothetical protein
MAQHANEGHGVGWDTARILEIKSNNRYRKYDELTHTTCLINPMIQPSLDVSPIWIPFISNKVSSL